MSDSRLLHYSSVGAGEPLIILHGLFGSSKNWRSLASEFGKAYQVFSLDLRNHGDSFHHEVMNYEAMADDVFRVLRQLKLDRVRIIGHSMGGKVAMVLAMKHAQAISQLLVADIAPLVYSHGHDDLINPILALPLDQLENRAAVDQALATSIDNTQLRNFLMQNLARSEGQWHWKVNWPVIQRELSNLTDFPVPNNNWAIDTPTLFIRGAESSYITASGEQLIAEHFTHARIETIAGAGHWLHAEQPVAFAKSALDFFQAADRLAG